MFMKIFLNVSIEMRLNNKFIELFYMILILSPIPPQNLLLVEFVIVMFGRNNARLTFAK